MMTTFIDFDTADTAILLHDLNEKDESCHSKNRSINFTAIWPRLREATMTPFTTEQMFHHDNRYDNENMSVGLWDALRRVKVR